MQTTSAHPAILFNARSLKNKLPDLHQLNYSCDVSRLTFISETWLNSSVTNSMLDPRQQFEIYRCDRQVRTGGGVCAMIPTIYKSHEHTFSNDERLLLESSGCEAVCIDVTINKSKYRFIAVYRPPLSSTDIHVKTTNLKSLIDKLTHPLCNTIIVGDFNLPKINWSENVYPCDGLHDVMYDCFSSLGFIQFVNEPSRISCSGNSNILDLIFCNNSTCVNIDMLDSPICNSDHATIHFSIFAPTTDSVTNSVDNTIKLTQYNWSAAD